MLKTLLTAGALSLAALTATAQTTNNCNTYENAQTFLSGQYGEVPVWEGVVSSLQFLVQLWVNEQTGTWTALSVAPDGMACIVADGMAYTFVDPPVQGDEM